MPARRAWAAPVHNLANLVGFKQLSVTGTFTPYFPQRRQVFAASFGAPILGAYDSRIYVGSLSLTYQT